MNRTKQLKGECQHCGGHIEFLADQIGMIVPCPHCGQETELMLAQPPEQSDVPRRAIIWTAVAVIILGLGLAGAVIALRRAQRWAEQQKHQAGAKAVDASAQPNAPPTPEDTNAATQGEIAASAVTLEKAPGTSLVYAFGTITNTFSRQRFGLKVELELLDGSGKRIGTATDYKQVLEPGAQWQFKALVVDSKATTARIASIKEDQ